MAKTPFIYVEKIPDSNKYHVIEGFKYIDGIRLLMKKDLMLYCTVVGPFKNPKERSLATLQCCIVQREKPNIKNY